MNHKKKVCSDFGLRTFGFLIESYSGVGKRTGDDERQKEALIPMASPSMGRGGFISDSRPLYE